jgi:copper chaperone CopZ
LFVSEAWICGACAGEIERVARQVPGFTEFVVNPASQLARWVAACPQAIDELVNRAGRLGYVLGFQESAPGFVQVWRNWLVALGSVGVVADFVTLWVSMPNPDAIADSKKTEDFLKKCMRTLGCKLNRSQASNRTYGHHRRMGG